MSAYDKRRAILLVRGRALGECCAANNDAASGQGSETIYMEVRAIQPAHTGTMTLGQKMFLFIELLYSNFRSRC